MDERVLIREMKRSPKLIAVVMLAASFPIGLLAFV